MNLTELAPIQPTGSELFDEQLAQLTDSELDCGEEIIRIALESARQHGHQSLESYLRLHLISFDQEKVRRLQVAAVETVQLERLVTLE